MTINLNLPSFTSSWKTTVSSVLSAVGSFILFSAADGMITWPKWAMSAAMFAHLGGLVGFGISAKDASVHSTAAEVVKATEEEEEEAPAK